MIDFLTCKFYDFFTACQLIELRHKRKKRYKTYSDNVCIKHVTVTEYPRMQYK
jgi:hypothetical protein